MNLLAERGLRNLARANDDALLAKHNTPAARTAAPNPLDGHDVALYVDGARISLSYLEITSIEAGGVSILAETALDACLNPSIEAVQSLAWGGFVPLQVVNYQAGPNEPSGGVFQITSVRLPTEPGGATYFLGSALTDLYDWTNDGRMIAAAGDACEIVSTHVVRQ